MRPIVFALDPKQWVNTPVRWAMEFAAKLGSEVVVAHVHTGLDPDFWENVLNVQQVVEMFAARTPWWSVILGGDPASAVIDYASGIGAGLIVAGSGQSSGLLASFRNSTSAEFHRNAPCAVLTLNTRRADPDLAFACSTVLCATDFDLQSASLVTGAWRLAETLAARLSVLHVMPEISEGLLAAGVENGPELVLDSQEALNRLRGLAADSGARSDCFVASGSFEKAIAQYARGGRSGLVVCSRSRLAQHGISSLLRRLDCPLLTFPEYRNLERSKPRLLTSRTRTTTNPTPLIPLQTSKRTSSRL